MKPFDMTTFTTYQYSDDDYKDLPLTVLDHFEWALENPNEGGHKHLQNRFVLAFENVVFLDVGAPD